MAFCARSTLLRRGAGPKAGGHSNGAGSSCSGPALGAVARCGGLPLGGGRPSGWRPAAVVASRCGRRLCAFTRAGPIVPTSRSPRKSAKSTVG